MTRPIVHVVGARPNFMKAAPVIKALDANDVPQQLVHTGQHYDAVMSDVFFAELDLPAPDCNLGVGSGSHAQQTAALMARLEPTLTEADPCLVVVYGDVNSTLAASLVAAKLQQPLAHVEAGLRSFDMTMPEEINRRVTDTVADILLCTSPEAMAHLGAEGIEPSRIHLVGNPMIDTVLSNIGLLDPARITGRLQLVGAYGVVTLHRPANVDEPCAASAIVNALGELSQRLELVLPQHPRGREALSAAGLRELDRVRVIEPLGYVDFLSLVRGASLVLTDSGGVQEETTALGIPCLTIRPNTERPATITHGTNRLVATSELPSIAEGLLSDGAPSPAELPPLWDGKAGERIARILQDAVDSEGRSNGRQPYAASHVNKGQAGGHQPALRSAQI